jgi:hypothetical protein
MRNVILISAVVATMTVAGCAAVTVSSHIERGANFAEYLTYDWGPPDNLPVGDPRLDNNPFFRDFILGAIEKRMAAKGFERAVSGQPDLLIHYHASVNQRVEVYETDHRYGYCYGDCQPQVVDYEQGTIVIDVVETATSKVVWRGWAQGAMNGVIDHQDRLEHRIDTSVTELMRLLPRGGAALR